ncbi:MAG: nucleolar DEAD-box protein required for synthesis of 60S ribosomal subunit [Cirrosporium novae-zelandiae]|nr:MAG: nucleolar DEAD-box protein required for synthesis of 60S ribosomal subunit [Cirrosporium novae-zelandiae]
MAPTKRPLSTEDDFIVTLSDDENDIQSGEELAQDPSSASIKIGKKRKLAHAELSKANTSKRTKKSKKIATDIISDHGSEIEANAWGDKGEDDGAFDPDFEFEFGADTGVTEDFDGWAVNHKNKEQRKSGDKKGVDIDEIISRRRANKNGTEALNGDATVEHKYTIPEEEEEEKEEKEETEDEMADEDEDELLAADGFGMGAPLEFDDEAGEENSEDEAGEENDEDSASEDDSVATPVPHPGDDVSDASSDSEEEDPEEQARRKAFFAPEQDIPNSEDQKDGISSSFQNMSLSRPVIRGLTAIGFSNPTPIQRKTIPVALMGKDVVGGAVTGSGKTAAFVIPILERLVYRPRKFPTTRVAILMPTRELAVQCFNVAKKLASFTDITFCQLVGGFSLREQENILKTRPDIIIATPGRFIDHMRNSASFTVETLEILVLDEADRMLEDGFADELNEILTTIPKSRQTMLFSATMTDTVDKLIRVGLNRPVRLMVDAKRHTVGTLVQEFVRLRPGREDKRMGYLMYLCTKIFTDRVIIFFRQKKVAHQARIIFGLLGLQAAELHGNMSQEQRISSVESFRDGKAEYLLATDVASRGLDIKGVETVINYEAPQSHEIYLHRVGRTARAGRTGRACTLAAEPDRKVVKAAVKAGRAQGAKIVSRTVEQSEADKWAQKVEYLQEEVEEVLKEEKEEKQLAQVEMQVTRGENLMVHQNEIMSRPKRTWFESEKDKRSAKQLGRLELNGPDVSGKKEKMKLSGKDKKRLDDSRQRQEGNVWKKGRAERGGRGAVSKFEKPKGGKRSFKAGNSKRR